MGAFEDLEIWRRSRRLSVEIYKALEGCRHRAFQDQATRAALSIPSNVAEGYERNSRKEFIRFLCIAKGSCGELRTQLDIGSEVGFLPREDAVRFIEETRHITRMLGGLIARLKRQR